VNRFSGIGIAAALAALLLGGGIWWLVADHTPRRLAPARPVPAVAGNVELRLGRPTIHLVSKGKVVWTVEAANLDTLKDRSLLRITGLRQAMVEKTGHAPLTITAGVLEQDLYTNNITLSDAVTVTAPELTLRSPLVVWDAFTEVLQFPKTFSAQLGDYTVTTATPTYFDVKAASLRCYGPVVLAAKGNTLRALGMEFNVADQSFALIGPMVAEMNVASMASWAEGKNVPTLPRIPHNIEDRYLADMAKRQDVPPAPPAPARVPPFRPLWKGLPR
jgi:hypothetical protein